MKQYLTRTERTQGAIICGMMVGCGIPLAITIVTAIIELFHWSISPS